MRQRDRSRFGDEGATLVEGAIALPVLALFVFGIIDFGWALSQNVDVKSAAREGARLAIVNGGAGGTADDRRNDLIAKVKLRSTELNDSETAVFLQLEDDDGDGNSGEIGETVVVCLKYPLRSLTGFSEPFLNGHLRSKAVMRMEKVADFSEGGSTSPPWGSDACAST